MPEDLVCLHSYRRAVERELDLRDWLVFEVASMKGLQELPELPELRLGDAQETQG
jgi:hypothetical protein